MQNLTSKDLPNDCQVKLENEKTDKNYLNFPLEKMYANGSKAVIAKVSKPFCYSNLGHF